MKTVFYSEKLSVAYVAMGQRPIVIFIIISLSLLSGISGRIVRGTGTFPPWLNLKLAPLGVSYP